MFDELFVEGPGAGGEPVRGPSAWGAPEVADGLDDVAAGDDPLGGDWGPGSLTLADAPAPGVCASFMIAYGTGLEDPGVVEALTAASRGSGSVGSAEAARVAGVASRLGREAGGVLASAVQEACAAGVGVVGDLSDDAVVGLVAAGQRLSGFAVGAQLVGAAELVRRYEGTNLLGEAEAVAELALETGLSGYAMQQRVYAARVLPDRFPAVYAALVSGALEWAKAWAILDKAVNLPAACDARYEHAALAYALGHNQPQLWGFLSGLVLKLDPEGAAERAKAAHARRGVRVMLRWPIRTVSRPRSPIPPTWLATGMRAVGRGAGTAGSGPPAAGPVTTGATSRPRAPTSCST